MSVSIKAGFVIGFALAAIFGGAWAWREGLLRPEEQRRADMAPSGSGSSGTGSESTPSPRATPPSVAPTPLPARPSATPTPGATPPSVTPPRAGPDRNPTADAAEKRKGAFDVVRVEPSGDAVVAGRCAAGCTAELTANGRTIDTAKADAGGSFVMTPPALAPGDHQLGLKVTTPDGTETSEQSVTVSVPKAPSKEVVVVLNEPDAPSKILQQPGQEPAAASASPEGGERLAARSDAGAPAVETVAALSLGAIDAEKGRFFVQGTAPAGSKLRIYLNNALISEAVAGVDGRWSLRVERGLTAGRYVARVDHVDAGGKVVTRAEAGFDYESAAAAAEPAVPAPVEKKSEQSRSEPNAAQAANGKLNAASPAETAASGAAPASSAGAAEAAGGADAAADRIARRDRAAPSESPASAGEEATGAAPARSPAAGSTASESKTVAPSEGPNQPERPSPPVADPANPVVAQIDTAQVRRGDSLWRISRTTYGQGRRYTVIFSANDQQIRDPDLIYPGQVLVLPTGGAEASSGDRR